MTNSTIVEFALALGVSPTVVLAGAFALTVGLSVSAGMAGAIGFRRVKPTPREARIASVLFSGATIVPLSALLDFGVAGVVSVSIGFGLFAAAFRLLRADFEESCE